VRIKSFDGFRAKVREARYKENTLVTNLRLFGYGHDRPMWEKRRRGRTRRKIAGK
jgi:hypothetical protein